MPCACLREQQRRKVNMVRSVEEQQQQPAEKQCRVCERLLPIGNYRMHGAIRSGSSSACKECNRKGALLAVKRREQFRGQLPAPRLPDVRRCTACKQIKAYSEFTTSTQNVFGIAPVCRACGVQRWRCRYSSGQANSTSETSAEDTVSTLKS